jgi:uncharacterized membrane protein (UPF0182 family)
MIFLDYVFMLAWLLIIVSPIILIWGFFRYAAFAGMGVLSKSVGSQSGIGYTDVNKKRGRSLIIIGIVGIAVAILLFWIANKFYPAV